MRKLLTMSMLLMLTATVSGVHSARAVPVGPGLGVLAAVIQAGEATVVAGGEPDNWDTDDIGQGSSEEWHTNGDGIATSTAAVVIDCAGGTLTLDDVATTAGLVDIVIAIPISNSGVYAAADLNATVSGVGTKMIVSGAGTCTGTAGVLGGVDTLNP